MTQTKEAISAQEKAFIEEVVNDYQLACESREASLLGRKEVLTGKAKFGIFGDGKEVAQIAMAKQFRNGDFRSGYYRDQTFMMAIGALTIKQTFAALYAHTDETKEPASAGRQMGGHFSTRTYHTDGTWKDLMSQKNSSADISPTAGQMPRLLGLAQASKVYRNHEGLASGFEKFTSGGNEVAFGTIGDASTSEGVFMETMNAAGVLQVPMVMSVWDDGYGISVPKKYQTTKGSISELLKGFQRDKEHEGFEIICVKGWDYPGLVSAYERGVKTAREAHVPVLIHVEEMTQPQGHSTSGSHERYKSKERLEWAKEYDCIAKMRSWMLEAGIAEAEELDAIEKQAKKDVRAAQKAAWSEFQAEIDNERSALVGILESLAATDADHAEEIKEIATQLSKTMDPIRKDVISAGRKVLRLTRSSQSNERAALSSWIAQQMALNEDRYNSFLYNSGPRSALKVEEVAPQFGADAEKVDGRIVLRDNFAALFERYPQVLVFGEDVGKIGGVNQSMEGMQEQFGALRVSDTGIREATIVGQGIGMALRGLRPIAEIQYLDYLLYALQILSDDLATLHYRTKGGQIAPLIISTRGHRLEGIWHSGSPMGTVIHALRGIYVCVPRNMVTAAGFYNTMLQSDDPALIIEPLNGYRSKEPLPMNLGTYTTPLGIPEVVRSGTQLTIVSYGSTCNLAEAAVDELAQLGISAELIDVRTLLPFDLHHSIVESLKKTNRLLIVDEDVPGGASAFILDKILNEQKGYYHLDSEPVTLTAKPHRPAYGSDGDYFSKPSVDDIVETAYQLMHEADPAAFPAIQ